MTKNKKETYFDVHMGLPEGQAWSAEKIKKIKAFAIEHDRKRTPEQRRENAMAAIKFRMEQYVSNEEDNNEEERTIEDFVTLYLVTLNINFKTFAIAIDSSDANLKKYLKGDRKFNEDLACRFGRFFHVSPLTWMRVQHKNDLLRLAKISMEKQYRKYDYQKLVK